MEEAGLASPTWLADIVIYLAMLTLFVVPMARIFVRAGFSWAWGLVCFLPFFGILLAWVLLLVWRWTWRDA